MQNEQTTIGGVYYTSLLLKRKILLITVTLIFSIASVIISLNMQNWYCSTVNAVPPKTTSSMMDGAMSSISSTLKDFGLTKLGGKGGGGDSYSFLVILQSRQVKDSLIAKYDIIKRYDMEEAKMSEVRTVFDENVEISVETEGNYVIKIYDPDPSTAAQMANDYIAIANGLSVQLAHTEATINKEYIQTRINSTDSLLKIISEQIEKYSKKYGVFSPEDQAKALSSGIVDLKTEVMQQEIVLNMVKNKYGENDAFTKLQAKMVDELKQKLNEAETKPGFGGNFALTDAANVGINFLKLYAEYQTFTKMKAFLMPMLEEIKINEKREIQSLLIIDKAIPADKKARPKRSLIVLGAALGGFVLTVLYILCIDSYKRFKIKSKELESITKA